ncbi:Peroxisomal acyl-coenzyme A oxidase 1 [Actinomortierella ambigua]|nr:Peroxisomal acyl-coenzyme A oxidase 1 [Actinomortierella ambigua]
MGKVGEGGFVFSQSNGGDAQEVAEAAARTLRRKVVPELVSERALVSFPVEAMTKFLVGRDLERQREICQLVESDETFSNADRPFLSREQNYVRALQKAAKLVEWKIQHKWSEDDMLMAMKATGDSLPLFLHEALFIPTLKTQMSDEQLKKWLPLAWNCEIFGCYAQTELGHGSNLRKLETTATFIPESDEFELNTPTLTSKKWWPGALGQSSNFAAVYARLILHGRDYGVHPFLVQIRDRLTHQPMPGCEIGNIGKKIGFDNIDNGFLGLSKVRIPRDQLMMRNIQVSPKGEFQHGKHGKLGYATMIKIRAIIVRNGGWSLAQALTCAVRYSLVRTQGGETLPSQGGREVKILDHAMQRFRLTTSMALAYASIMSGIVMMDLYHRNLSNTLKGDVALLAETHATSSGLKALCSDLTLHAIEDTRRACGGVGYNWASGICELYTTFLQDVTVEGENTILHLQTARWLLKSILAAQKSGKLDNVPSGLVPYLKDPSFTSHQRSALLTGRPVSAQTLIDAYWHREARLLQEMLDRIRQHYPSGFSEQVVADHMVDLVELSRAHCEGILVRNFDNAIHAYEQGAPAHKGVVTVLRKLQELHGLHRLLERVGDFVLDGYLSPAQATWCKERRQELVDALRYDLIGLVDAFDFSDNQLNSAIGRFDGRVYESQYEWAKYGMTLVAKGKDGGVLGHDEVLQHVFTQGRKINASKL